MGFDIKIETPEQRIFVEVKSVCKTRPQIRVGKRAMKRKWEYLQEHNGVGITVAEWQGKFYAKVGWKGFYVPKMDSIEAVFGL